MQMDRNGLGRKVGGQGRGRMGGCGMSDVCA